MKLVIVTGLSGSGKSTALHTLEDLGYYCIDNLPVFLLRALGKELEQTGGDSYHSTAVGIDARNQANELRHVPAMVKSLREQGVDCRILFLEAENDILIRRFSETRRKHPLTDAERPLAEAIQLERLLLEPLLSHSDLHIDTTHTNIHELRGMVRQRLADAPVKEISLLFQSFGYKHGIPRDADFVFDVRCLPNPHWKAELRPFTGRDRPVEEFLGKSELVQRMEQEIGAYLERWITAFEAEGRNYLTVAIGCTGGQHRSVYLVEQLAQRFRELRRRVLIRHRELP